MTFRLIDITKPIKFVDDRNKGVEYICDNIKFHDNDMCLCYSNQFNEDTASAGLKHHDSGMILFNIHTGQVANSALSFYYAENY